MKSEQLQIEDIELGAKLKREGGRIRLVPEAWVRTARIGRLRSSGERTFFTEPFRGRGC